MDMIKLRAKAKTLGIEGYKGMSSAELQDAIKGAEGSSGKTGAKAAKKSSANGTKSGRKTAVKKAVAKATAKVKKAAPKKSGRKTASAKSQPAKAKRATTGAKRTNSRKSSTPTRKSSNGVAGRNIIDNSQIDWTAESGVGASEPRATIIKWLRKFQGDVQKVYNKLEGDVATLYKSNKRTGEKYTQAKRKELLRWHISRVKFDFVMDTEQHERSTNRTNSSSGAKSAPVKSSNGRKTASKTSTKSAATVNLKELSDRQLQNIVRKQAGKRGRKSAETLAAIKELDKRQKAAGRSSAPKKSAPARKSSQAPAKRQTASRKPASGRKTAASRKR